MRISDWSSDVCSSDLVDYQVTDAIEFGTHFSYSRQKYDGTYNYWRDDSRATYFSGPVPGGRGASAMLDNPYLPDSVRQVMLDNNLTSLYIDRTYGNFPEREIGRAHVWTPVTNAHLVCRLLLEKKNKTKPKQEHTHK